MDKNTFIHIVDMFLTMYIVWVFAKNIVRTLTDRIYDKLRNYGECHLFEITKGDTNRQDELKEIERNNKASILANLLGTALLNIICSVVASKLFN
jgi:hypothetical protein